MTAKKKSLAEFAKQFEKPSCPACVMSERIEFDQAYKGGVTRKTIFLWLTNELGYGQATNYDETGKVTGIAYTTLDKHFQNKHHFNKEVV